MQNGLYKVTFHTPLGTGAGAVVLRDGTVQGGDSSMYYSGTFSETGNQFTGQIHVARHTVGLPSTFGRDDVHVTLNGTTNGDTAQVTGTAKEVPNVKLSARLERLKV